jgi:EAL domain-containing protein (putative c-di-GMP-specific phosphodiesterase class I)
MLAAGPDSQGALEQERLFATLMHSVSNVVAILDAAGRIRCVNQAAERIAKVMRAPVQLGGRAFFVGSSIGIAVNTPGDAAHDLLRKSDMAMYRSKEAGKGRCSVFDPTQSSQLLAHLELEADLRQALGRGELHVVYQPIVTVADGVIHAVEALVRWEHPRRGLIAPAEFIPLAEETGMIVALGQWVLEQACHQVRRWQLEYPERGRMTAAVNLSPRQVKHPLLVADIARVLSESGLPPRCLSLEITEGVVMDDAEDSVQTLRGLRALGVHLTIDDFGTGYSSLRYLKDFPVNTLKVDRTFIHNIDAEPRSSAIVQSVIALASALNVRVTAEGIETEAERAHLRR